MEVYFLDVGLGTCQIILLGNRRAIVIDAGIQMDHLALQFLRRLRIDRIVRLITSHSDNDHTGGAISILSHYQDAIDELHVVQDHKWLESKYWQRIEDLCRRNVLSENQIVRLELNPANSPKTLWRDGKSSLALYSPTFVQNQRSQAAGNANATSAVIVLDHLGKRVVFAADSEIPQWKKIHADHGQIHCDILAVPHHGGEIHDTATDLQWLYEQALRTQFAVISVGTKSNPKHPRQEVVRALIAQGAKVMCTQITTLCHPTPTSIGYGVLQPQTHLGRSLDGTLKQRRPKCVACAGTVLATISRNGLVIDRVTEHQMAVDRLTSKQGTPLCR